MVEIVQVLPLAGKYDEADCLDLDPIVLYQDGICISEVH